MLIYRSGTFEISNAEGVQPGTKIVIHLKPENREFSDENVINRKYISDININIYIYIFAFICNKDKIQI